MQAKNFFVKQYRKSPTFFLLAITTSISFLFFLWGINSWRFAFAGDEWPFYLFAKDIASSPFYPNPFSFAGVYSTHSVLASIYQSLFLRILGPSNFAWRLSNIILIFPISYFFYRWAKEYFTKEIAVISTIILQSSFYLANFFKIGYDNPQSITLFIICLYLVNHFRKYPTKKIAAWLGITMGISFYIYMGPLFPFFLWPFLLPLLRMLHKKEVRTATIIFVICYLSAVCPIFTDIHSLVPVINALGSPGSFHFKQTVLKDFLLFYKNNDYFYNHFVVGPYLDIFTRIFCFIGTIVIIFKLRKSNYLFLILSYITTTILIGSTSSDWFSPTTRGIFLLPYGFIFAGIGLNFLLQKIKNTSFAFVCCWYIIFAIFLSNVYQSQIGTFENAKPDNSGYTGMSLLIKSMMQAKEKKQSVVILLSSSQNINLYMGTFPAMVQAYGMDRVRYAVITPDDFHCQKDATSVLIFQKDQEALNKIASLHCPQNSLTQYSLLSPSITFF